MPATEQSTGVSYQVSGAVNQVSGTGGADPYHRDPTIT